MSVMTPVDKNAPLMIAFQKYKTSGEYANTRKWALLEGHVDGSLWAAFSAGFSAATKKDAREAE